METTIPADLLELKKHLDDWRAKKRYPREPLPAELRQAVEKLSRRYPPALLRRVLKLDPWRLRGRKAKQSLRAKPPKNTFFKLPAPIAPPEFPSSASPNAAGYRLLLERSDGARLTITLPRLEAAPVNSLCADFLRG
jgi:hypothetical protein